jgi:hypothetical protein
MTGGTAFRASTRLSRSVNAHESALGPQGVPRRGGALARAVARTLPIGASGSRRDVAGARELASIHAHPHGSPLILGSPDAPAGPVASALLISTANE